MTQPFLFSDLFCLAKWNKCFAEESTDVTNLFDIILPNFTPLLIINYNNHILFQLVGFLTKLVTDLEFGSRIAFIALRFTEKQRYRGQLSQKGWHHLLTFSFLTIPCVVSDGSFMFCISSTQPWTYTLEVTYGGKVIQPGNSWFG